MALAHSISITVGSRDVVFDGAYAKVTEYHGDKSRMTFVVQWSEQAGGEPLKQATYGCAINLDGPNPIAQAYIYLKSLPEFVGATDC